MRHLFSIALLLGASLLASCAADRQSNLLTTTLNAYAGTVRWGDLASAERFVDPAVRQAHPLTALDQSRFAQIRVSEYDDGAGPRPDGPNQVKQTVQIGLINVHTQSERSVVDHQVWRYDAEKKQWWLMSGLPDITEQ